MTLLNRVAIVGVGLIGGSIGLALRQRGLAAEVIGIGRREATLQTALDRGAVSQVSTNLDTGMADADLIIVCTPVAQIVETVQRIARHCPAAALITDVGSTKESVCSALTPRLPASSPSSTSSATFIGSHPLAGSEKSGVEHADANLFVHRPAVITPLPGTDEAAVARLAEFWTALGARVVRMTPAEHDQAVAAVSHLPHLLASVLAAAVPVEFLPLASTGWRSTTRVAAGSPELWEQILLDNRGHVLQSLDNFAKVLASFRQALQAGDSQEIHRILAAGKKSRDALGS